jgi:ORF6N domain
MTEITLKEENINAIIYHIRGEKIILDRDLATLYNVETKVFKQAVRRNINRFPADFMFELTTEEFKNWRSQFVTSNSDKMGLRYAPMAFTEQGIAMLSGVLNSLQAVEVNIAIMRTFVKMRQLIHQNQLISTQLQELERLSKEKWAEHDEKFALIFRAIEEIMEENNEERGQIGFQVQKE